MSLITMQEQEPDVASLINELGQVLPEVSQESYPSEAQALEVVTRNSPMGATLSRPEADSYSLIKYALENGKTEQLSQMIDLKNREEARAAKKEFDWHFAEMQAEFKPVPKRKETFDASGNKMYSYAPIEDIQAMNGPVIARHGFSYKWREEEVEKARRFYIMISGHGHTEETSFDVPPISGTKMMNAAQVAASMSTYGRRYTFMLGFGFAVQDEDDDGQYSYEDGVLAGEAVKLIREAKTVDELKTIYTTVSKGASSDREKMIIVEEKNRKYQELKKGEKA